MAVPYTFGSATTSIPLSQLDSNFATTITLGNTAIQLGNTVTTLNNMTLANVTVSSGNATVTNANVTTLTATNDASISGLTVGKGGGAVASNTAVGYQAALNNTTNVNGVFVGYQAGLNNANDGNTAVGYIALKANSSGSTNAAIGAGAMASNTSGISNTAVGGVNALTTNTTGSNNVALGSQALNSNTTASNNTAVGYQAGYNTTTAANNMYLGYQAGYSLTALSGGNTFVGVGSGYTFNTTSNGFNTLVGYQAGYGLTTGLSNTFVGSSTAGFGSGSAITTGSKNTILGAYTGNQGGLDIRTASNNIVLSDGDGNPRLIVDNGGYFFRSSTGSFTSGQNSWQLRADSGAIQLSNSGTGASTVAFFYNGNGTVGTIQTNGSVTLYNTTSDYRLKNVIGAVSNAGERLDALEPIEYDFKAGGRTRGFLAHQFAEVYPTSVSGEKDAVDEEGKPVYQAMQASSAEVMADLIAEIQSLRKRVALLESK